MPSFDADWLIPLGIAAYLLIPIVSLSRLHRKLARLQQPLDQLSKDVQGLLTAEERRLLREFRAHEAESKVKRRAPAAATTRAAATETVLQEAAPVGSGNGIARG